MNFRNGACILVIALAGGVANTTAVADDMFLKYSDGIVGDSTDPQHLNEVVVLSFSLGVTADSSWTKGGGASVGKPNPGELQYTAAMNRSVPSIVKFIASGRPALSATLTVRDATFGKTPFEYAKYTFTGIYFTSVGEGLNGAGRALNAVSAVYKTVQVQQFTAGNPVAVSCVIWDIPGQSALDC